MPADPNADSKARNLLCYLKTHAYVSGQTDAADSDKVQALTGRYPAITAFDFMEYTNGQIQTQSVIDWYNAHHGIVAFQWHWYCPHGGNYAAPCDFQPDLSNPSSKLYQDIDLIVAQLKKLGDAGIPVLFRPLHESNNDYMWWTKKGPDAYKQLWRLIHQRAQLAGVHNVLWVFNGMASGQSTALSAWYPGDSYADLVTSDYFQSPSDYGICASVGTGKTAAVAETFSPLDAASDPAWSYFVVWASRDWAGSGKDVQGLWKTAMANPKTISVDQLPDMTKW
nr:glycosyl hydrolase [Streptomyces sp. HPF1205]